MTEIKTIILESPFANADKNKFNSNYLYLCVSARKMMKESSFAPLFFHALYTQFLNDDVQEERELGLARSFAHHENSKCKVYAIDRGISRGMVIGAEDAVLKGIDIEFYTVLGNDSIVSKKIKLINEIKNPEKKWNAGVRYINTLLENPINKKSFLETGDLTLYSDYIKEELKDVKVCILEFFAPIVDSIRNEEILVNKVKIEDRNIKKLKRNCKI